MFTVKGVEKAVREMVRLLYLYDEEVGVEALVQDIDYENVTQYLINRLEPIYSYKAKGDCEKSFDYLGKELLPQRGALIYWSLTVEPATLLLPAMRKSCGCWRI